MSGKNIFTLFTFFLLLSGCSHSRPPLEVSSELFTTKITLHGIKLFVYQLAVKMPGGRSAKSGRGPSSGGGGGGRSGPPMQGGRGGGDQDDGDKELNLMLANKLKQNGFCRNGYIVLDRYQANNGSIRIRGECEEGATAEDRKAFPNS